MEWCIFYIAFASLVSGVRMMWYWFDKKGEHGKPITAVCLSFVLVGLIVPFVAMALNGNEQMLIYFALCGVGTFISLLSFVASLIRWKDGKKYVDLLKLKKCD